MKVVLFFHEIPSTTKLLENLPLWTMWNTWEKCGILLLFNWTSQTPYHATQIRSFLLSLQLDTFSHASCSWWFIHCLLQFLSSFLNHIRHAANMYVYFVCIYYFAFVSMLCIVTLNLKIKNPYTVASYQTFVDQFGVPCSVSTEDILHKLSICDVTNVKTQSCHFSSLKVPLFFSEILFYNVF